MASWRINATLLSVGFLLLTAAAAQQPVSALAPKADPEVSRRVAEIMKRALARDYSLVDGWTTGGRLVRGVTRITWVPPSGQDYADIAQLGESAVPALAAYLKPEAKPGGFVQLLAVRFLGYIGSASTIAPLGDALDAHEWQVARISALDILASMADPEKFRSCYRHTGTFGIETNGMVRRFFALRAIRGATGGGPWKSTQSASI